MRISVRIVCHEFDHMFSQFGQSFPHRKQAGVSRCSHISHGVALTYRQPHIPYRESLTPNTETGSSPLQRLKPKIWASAEPITPKATMLIQNAWSFECHPYHVTGFWVLVRYKTRCFDTKLLDSTSHCLPKQYPMYQLPLSCTGAHGYFTNITDADFPLACRTFIWNINHCINRINMSAIAIQHAMDVVLSVVEILFNSSLTYH